MGPQSERKEELRRQRLEALLQGTARPLPRDALEADQDVGRRQTLQRHEELELADGQQIVIAYGSEDAPPPPEVTGS